MAAHGGFEHNLQSLRVVDALEERYPQFDGLNLSFETREGILKHCSRANAERLEASEPGGVGRRFLDRTQPSLEAQLCNLADEIAYNAHDIDDGVRSGLITLEQLRGSAAVRLHGRGAGRASLSWAAPLLYEGIRRMLSAQVYDVIDATRAALRAFAPPATADEARTAAARAFSDARGRSRDAQALPVPQPVPPPAGGPDHGQAQDVVRDLFTAYLAARRDAGRFRRASRRRARWPTTSPA
jgi:dGTPase